MQNNQIIISTGSFRKWALEVKKIKPQNIIVFSWDHWRDDGQYLNGENENWPSDLSVLKNFAKENIESKFLVFTTVLSLENEFLQYSNVKIQYWGPDSLRDNSQNTHLDYDPEPTKNFESIYHWIMLCRMMRPHRVLAILFLLGSNLYSSGLIRASRPQASFDSIERYLTLSGMNTPVRTEILNSPRSHTYRRGFELIQNNQGFESNYKHESFPDNGKNFNQIRPFYRNSVLEIVVETVFFQEAVLVSEKFVNCIYGFNFFIALACPGYVAHLRQLQFDVFDDVIDHRYDQIVDPYLRLETAINSNRKILQNKNFAVEQWVKCQSRMQSNYELLVKKFKTSSYPIRQWAGMKNIQNIQNIADIPMPP